MYVTISIDTCVMHVHAYTCVYKTGNVNRGA